MTLYDYYSLLNDKEYVHELNLLLPTWIQEGKQDIGGPRSVWDWVKYRVKKNTLDGIR